MKLPKISGGFLNLTQKCNLKCKYCFVVQQPLEMTYTTAKDAVIFYAQNAIKEGREPSITFFGGEPMLKYNEIIKPLVEFIRSTYGDYDLSMTTNGTLLNEEKLKFFAQNNVRIMLSMDGDRETQDFNRPYHNGKGSFDDIDVDLFLKYYPFAVFRATVDMDTVQNMYKNYVWAEEKGYKNSSFIVNVFADWSEKQIEIFRSESRKIFDRILEKKKNGESYTNFNMLRDGMDNLRKLNSISEDYFRDAGQGTPACGRCGLGGSVYGSIGSSGDIYSCQEMTENPEFDEFIIGNIYTGVDDEKRMNLACSFNTRNVISRDLDRCESCELYKICDGGCTINNFHKYGELEVVPPIYCVFLQESLKFAKEMEVS